MNEMDALSLKLCDIQGRLFELSGVQSIPSAAFIRTFMASRTAKDLDSAYNRAHWMGEEYLLEEVKDAAGKSFFGPGDVFPKDVLYWIGYVYRYWHFYTGEESAKIIHQAPAKTMRRNYMMFHTMDPSLAIEDLKEIYKQKHRLSAV